jgi:hypothetical protein
MVENYNSKLNKLSNSEIYDNPRINNYKFSLRKHILNVTALRNYLKFQKKNSMPFNIILFKNNSYKENNYKKILKKPLKFENKKVFNSSSQNLFNIIKEKNSRNKINKNSLINQGNISNYSNKSKYEKNHLPKIKKSHSLNTFDYFKSFDSNIFSSNIKNNMTTIKHINRNYNQLLLSKTNILEEKNKKIFHELNKGRFKIKKINELIQSKYYFSMNKLKKNYSENDINNISNKIKEPIDLESLIQFIRNNVRNQFINEVNQLNQDLNNLNEQKIKIGKTTDLISRIIIRNNI